MKRTSISEALASLEPRNGVTVCGWVRTRRDSKTFAFLELNDGSCLKNLQVIIDEGTEAWAALEGVNTGAAVSVCGDLVESLGKGQKWEVRAQSMTVFGLADPATFPLQKKRHSDEFLRTIAHLRPRTNKYGAAFRIRSEAAMAIHDYFRGQGYYYVHAPILTGSDCEGAGEMFRVTTLPVDGGPKPESGNFFENDFFGKPASLTVSGMLEKGCARVSYRDAVDLLQKSGKKFEYPVSFGTDLQTEHERFLAEEYFKSPVTVYDYPKGIKAFYMRMNDDNETVAAMDLLVPRIGELVGGSQREERLDRLTQRIVELGQNPEDYWWYLDLRRFGSVPHSGFGMGFERMIMLLTGISNIRDVLPFPRTTGSLEF